MEEIPLLEKVVKEQREADKQFFEEQEEERVRGTHSTYWFLVNSVWMHSADRHPTSSPST